MKFLMFHTKLKFQNDKFRKLFTSEFSSKKIRLNLENEIDYKNLEKKWEYLKFYLLIKIHH